MKKIVKKAVIADISGLRLPDVRCECPAPEPMANGRHCLQCGLQLPETALSTVKDANKLLVAIQKRGSEATDLRDAAHEAHHALYTQLRTPWTRDRIHKALVRKARRRPMELVSLELDARAVEWTICDRYGIEYEPAKWADIVWWEMIKNMHISLPTDTWILDAITKRKENALTKRYADHVEALANTRQESRTSTVRAGSK